MIEREPHVPVTTIDWTGDLDGHAVLVDQRRLPLEFTEMTCLTVDEMYDAIKTLAVRGAPALGIAAAFGVLLGIQKITTNDPQAFREQLQKVIDRIGASRPTAVNLFWGLARMNNTALETSDRGVDVMRSALLDEALRIRDLDKEVCRRIGKNGAAVIEDGDTVLTHCNAGGLVTADFGTALACMFVAHEQGKQFEVFADETRPLLQGARLTTWELKRAGIPVTLICDNMAGHCMKLKKIDKVIVGADRIAANGDTANKIGTYSVAVLARAHDIPFYIAAPASTFDLSLQKGVYIPIEERDPSEVTAPFGTRIAPEGIDVYNPAFDVTPADFITGIITEFGIIDHPDTAKIARQLGAESERTG